MKPKQQRLIFILLSLVLAGIALFFILTNFRENMVFFYTPTDLQEKMPANDEFIRLGGMVAEGSVQLDAATQRITFIVTDYAHTLLVSYQGALPALFREGQGVVAEGYLRTSTQFEAQRILAKHDENYMPPELEKGLKKNTPSLQETPQELYQEMPAYDR